MPPNNYDETNPTDDYLVPSYPTNERAFRAAVKADMDVEHEAGEGVHKFGIGTTTERDAITTWVNGSVWGNTTLRSGNIVWQIRNSGSWESFDIEPVDGSSNATLPRVNGSSKFTACQWALWSEITVASGTPDTVTPLLAGSPNMWCTIVGDTQIANPTVPGGLGGYGTTFFLDVAMDGTGGHTITWGSQYRAPAVVQIATGANERTLLQCVGNVNGNFIVSSVPDFNLGL